MWTESYMVNKLKVSLFWSFEKYDQWAIIIISFWCLFNTKKGVN